MRRLFRSVFLVSTVAAAAACASRWPAQQTAILPGSAFGDSALNGAYRWTSLDGDAVPVEFPARSGRRLVYGTLDIRDAPAARSGTGGTYSMRFTEQPLNDTVRTTGNDGRFVLRGDSILFTPAGQTSPVIFRFAWRPTGDLTLTDGSNHVWVYARR